MTDGSPASQIWRSRNSAGYVDYYPKRYRFRFTEASMRSTVGDRLHRTKHVPTLADVTWSTPTDDGLTGCTYRNVLCKCNLRDRYYNPARWQRVAETHSCGDPALHIHLFRVSLSVRG